MQSGLTSVKYAHLKRKHDLFGFAIKVSFFFFNEVYDEIKELIHFHSLKLTPLSPPPSPPVLVAYIQQQINGSQNEFPCFPV